MINKQVYSSKRVNPLVICGLFLCCCLTIFLLSAQAVATPDPDPQKRSKKAVSASVSVDSKAASDDAAEPEADSSDELDDSWGMADGDDGATESEDESGDAAADASDEASADKADCGHTPRPTPPKINFSVTNTLTIQYVGDNDGASAEAIYGDDDNFWTFRDNLYVQARNRFFDSSLMLSSVLFHNPPRFVSLEGWNQIGWDENSQGYTRLYYDNDYRIERLHGTVHLGKLHITGGDFYVNFGRGMAISLIKQPDTGTHNTLRGAKIEYKVPRKMQITAVGGVVNALNIDTLTQQIQRDDPLDRIAGLRIQGELADALSLGAHGVYLSPRFTDWDDIDPGRRAVDQSTGVGVITGGATAELHLGGLHVYLEGNAQQHDNYHPTDDDFGESLAVEDESGYAAFGEISYDLSPVNIKLEGLYYRRWTMEGPLRGSANNPTQTLPLAYHHLVTLETKWMVIKSLGNSKGGKLTGDLFLRDSNTQFTLTNTMLVYDGGLLASSATWDDHPQTLINHPILKVRQIFGDSGVQLALEGGFRYEKNIEDEIDLSIEKETGHMWHAKLDLSTTLSGPHSMELISEIRRFGLWVTEDSEYWTTLTSLGYEWASLFGLSISHEYSDQLAIDVEGVEQEQRQKIGSLKLPWPVNHYFFLMGHFHTPAPLDQLSFRAFLGAQRGGFKCIGGVCRVYPDTVGGWVEAVYRF